MTCKSLTIVKTILLHVCVQTQCPKKKYTGTNIVVLNYVVTVFRAKAIDLQLLCMFAHGGCMRGSVVIESDSRHIPARPLPVTRAVFCNSFPLKFVHDSTDSTRLEP